MRRALLLGIGIALALVPIFLVADGLASLLAVVSLAVDSAAGASHSRYDPLLGWSGRPGAHIPNYYGPAIGVRINAQGLRADRDFSQELLPDRQRIICLGDSFTFGHGVRADEAWPARLQEMAPGQEAVNMGQEGYGLDQMLLWYRRDGGRLRHQLVILAVVGEDLRRMSFDSFQGFSKPYLILEAGGFRLQREPLPSPAGLDRISQYALAARQLQSVSLFGGLLAGKSTRGEGTVTRKSRTDLAELTSSIIAALDRQCRANQASLAVIFLPTMAELLPLPEYEFRGLFRQACLERNVPFADLTDDFRQVPEWDRDLLFLPEPFSQTLSAIHYSPAGHTLTAELILRRLVVAGKMP